MTWNKETEQAVRNARNEDRRARPTAGDFWVCNFWQPMSLILEVREESIIVVTDYDDAGNFRLQTAFELLNVEKEAVMRDYFDVQQERKLVEVEIWKQLGSKFMGAWERINKCMAIESAQRAAEKKGYKELECRANARAAWEALPHNQCGTEFEDCFISGYLAAVVKSYE